MLRCPSCKKAGEFEIDAHVTIMLNGTELFVNDITNNDIIAHDNNTCRCMWCGHRAKTIKFRECAENKED